MSDSIQKIIALEWQNFQNVANEGGRASCQDDPTTFSIMRESQFIAWDEKTRRSYLNDLLVAQARGENLVELKYARMMQVTAPEAYDALHHQLPRLSSEVRALANDIHATLLAWQREFMAAYPHVASGGRPLHERANQTASFDAYLMGELLTYSEKTLYLLAQCVKHLREEGKNMSLLTMEHMVRRYGYQSLDQAEEKYRLQALQSTA